LALRLYESIGKVQTQVGMIVTDLGTGAAIGAVTFRFGPTRAPASGDGRMIGAATPFCGA
jgi:hypothetical protein